MILAIEIQEPIWKDRSVGINLQNSGPDDSVTINILYENKDGKRLWPHEYVVPASWVQKYPVQHLTGKNVDVHLVPIADLNAYRNSLIVASVTPSQNGVNSNTVSTKSTNSSLNFTNNQTTMLFDNKQIEDIRKENQERTGFDNRKKVPMGANVLTILEITGKPSTKGDQMLVIKFKKDDEHKEMLEFLMLEGKGSDIAKSKIIDWFERSFNYVIQPCNTAQDLVNQLQQFVNKQLQAAVKHEKSLFTTKDGDVKIVRQARVWYVDAINAPFNVDLKKCLKELSPKDVERVNQLNEMGKTVTEADYEDQESDTQKAAENNAANSTSGESDDLPF